jgi:chloramphenicol-sensitive protein RarD
MERNNGALYATGAYIAWGLLPIYWKALKHVPPLEILAHRIIWALVVSIALVAIRRRGAGVIAALRQPRTLAVFAASGILLAINWIVYIWAVQQGFVVETSLGYYINPLINVLLGVLFLRERLRLGQGAAVAIALCGVVYLTFAYGSLPWIALTLAVTFGIYGLLRKTAALGSLEGLTLETLLLIAPSLVYVFFLGAQGQGALGHSDAITTALLLGSGIVTTVPLLLFAAGARRVTLITLGILQYIAPTLQFALGTLLYGETLSPQRLAGFCLIWLALAVYTVESQVHQRLALARRGQAGGAA